ncbi:hypothetical protein Areg01_19600 [Actinoplanes regularis]|nr:hypothetical protein Areg01_19600 [Actinoplanes regularis]
MAGYGEQGGVGVGTAGVVNVFLSGAGPSAAARSAYLAQVRRIAPPELQDRDPELAELARFCLDDRRGPYVWWQAGPWAGKSALLSTFVLNPPAQVRERVQVVAFFITARLAGSDTRAAFTAAVTEQLVALTGEKPPPVVDEGSRERWMLDLLTRAAATCLRREVRLVLLVDGLDEDRSTTGGDGAHSIAGLLPANPPAGMRIVVAGRPDPPIPDDVPHWHPLRDPGIVRRLTASPYAQNLQHLGRDELRRLLKGTRVEQDLLGLLTAARGGLSGADLRELTAADPLDIEDVLHTVAGRTFTRRTAHWDPVAGPEVYLLGHEELQQTAAGYLGESRLAAYRARLHAWADNYRTPGDTRPAWPAGTPEYLLRGYPRVLADTRDLPRLVDLATDSVRHDRMFDLSGGDTTAINEIIIAQNLVLAEPEPDLEVLALLSIRRNSLADRNTKIPTDLPAVWAQLGRPARAEALARSIPGSDQQAKALAAVVPAVAAAGDPDHAEALARSIPDQSRQAAALTMLVKAAATAGDHGRAWRLAADAEQIARSIPVWYHQATALTMLVKAVAAAGDPDRAEQIARSGPDPYQRVEVLTALAVSGDHDRARRLAADAEQIARSIADSYWRDQALSEVAPALAAAGDRDRAEQIARALTDTGMRESTLTEVAREMAAAGEHDRAERVARSITDRIQQVLALADVVRGVAAAGDHGRAEQIARSIPDPYLPGRAQALADVVREMAVAGDHDRAEQIARSVPDPYWQVQALVMVIGAVAGTGDDDRVRRLAAAAEQIAWSASDPKEQRQALIVVLRKVAAVGDHDRAEQIARGLTEPYQQAEALTVVARAAATAGDHDRGRRLAAEAGRTARSVADPYRQTEALIAVVRAVAATGDHARAERIARGLTDPNRRARALAVVAGEVAGTGDYDRAEQAGLVHNALPISPLEALLAKIGAVAGAGEHDRAEQIARATTDPHDQAMALATLAGALAVAGEHDRAEQTALSITDPYEQAKALTALARVVGPPGAYRLLGEAFAAGPWWIPLPVVARIAPEVVLQVADVATDDEVLRAA